MDIPKPEFEIAPCEEMFFVGSCFADSIGQRFREEGFPVTVNPYGTMYNPASILHTVRRTLAMSVQGGAQSPALCCEGQSCRIPDIVFLTLGTNHIYRLRETGEIVDNCQKRPAALFQEEELSVDQCADYLQQTINLLHRHYPKVRIVLTVSPIRYRKYGYHESQLSKATLLLAVDHLLKAESSTPNSQRSTHYFPAYEIVMDELRDYRFYASDMLHPSGQAVEYIWERLVGTYFSAEAKSYLDEWRPLKQALAHRPFNPEAAEYKALMDKTMLKVAELQERYPKLTVPLHYELHH